MGGRGTQATCFASRVRSARAQFLGRQRQQAMDLKIKGRVALVTGGSRGLGKALALGLAEEGAHVAICARNRERLENAAREVIATGAECLAIPADLADPAACADVVAQTMARFGRID